MSILSGKRNRAGQLLRILGEHLPPEVFRKLGPQDTSKLLESFHKSGKIEAKQERELLGSFLEGLSSVPKEGIDRDTLALIQELETILKEDLVTEPEWSEELKSYTKEELSKIVAGESPDRIGLVFCYADPDTSARVLEEFPEETQEEILLSIRNLDLSSAGLMDSLERFLRFKKEVLKSPQSGVPTRDKGGKRAAELLGKLDPQDSQKLFSRIREKSQSFAENINKHFFRMEDLMDLSREALNKFMADLHPIVTATAFKGTEPETKQVLLERLDPSLASSIRLEEDSMGPVSLAEIETAQNGLLEIFKESVESGRIKFRRKN
ncbi:FliG C-terminal domain-containing protein [Leptospira licerasiae]|uniref:FliG C-terminal domain protein n=1 Tax=Leptospira licerasiae str. MMD4847 TaxID=1049971 RepID=A0ABN0H8P9_9LEPT|nr:FliG C-terminal domain-containing protein [Leptospira licerasiae]EIE00141.1 FliG C-terminal domain protein [Leptospira licerasiae serovar Varillal str. VAR 010]EJZ42158.1 FliG C-terminal domain protein [Leptospira licerasiae str. MMD4847]